MNLIPDYVIKRLRQRLILIVIAAFTTIRVITVLSVFSAAAFVTSILILSGQPYHV